MAAALFSGYSPANSPVAVRGKCHARRVPRLNRWWSPRLIVAPPDWLSGERGPDVSPRMFWIPFVTFWQVTADLVFSTGVPDGHGHKYEADYANGWARVAQPPGWTDADTERLRELIGGR